MGAVKMYLSNRVKNKWFVEQFDVETAFVRFYES